MGVSFPRKRKGATLAEEWGRGCLVEGGNSSTVDVTGTFGRGAATKEGDWATEAESQAIVGFGG